MVTTRVKPKTFPTEVPPVSLDNDGKNAVIKLGKDTIFIRTRTDRGRHYIEVVARDGVLNITPHMANSIDVSVRHFEP